MGNRLGDATSPCLLSHAAPELQLVAVARDPDGSGASASLIETARRWTAGLVSVVTPDQARNLAESGVSLYEDRFAEVAYFCVDTVCHLPVSTAEELTTARSADLRPSVPETAGVSITPVGTEGR